MSPSKTFNLSGLSCGFAVIPNHEIRQRFQTAACDLVPQPNALGVVACRAAYEGGETWRAALVDYLRGNRDLLESFFCEQLPQLSLSHVEATYLAWIDARWLGERNGTRFFDAAGVRLSDGGPFQGQGFVRLNFGCPRKDAPRRSRPYARRCSQSRLMAFCLHYSLGRSARRSGKPGYKGLDFLLQLGAASQDPGSTARESPHSGSAGLGCPQRRFLPCRMTLPTISPFWEPRPAAPVLASDMSELGVVFVRCPKVTERAKIPLQGRHVVIPVERHGQRIADEHAPQCAPQPSVIVWFPHDTHLAAGY